MDPSKPGWWFGNNDDNYMTGTNTYPSQEQACNPPYSSHFTVDAPSNTFPYPMDGGGPSYGYDYDNFCSQGLGGVSLVDQPATYHINEGTSSTAHPLPIFHQPQPSYSHMPDAWPWTNSDPDSHVTPWVTNPDPEDEIDDEVCARVAMEQELEFISSLLQVAIACTPQRTPYHTRPGIGFEWVCDILRSDHPKKSTDNFSMTKETYLGLCQELVVKYGFSISSEDSISILESLGMFLCLLRGMNLQHIDSCFNRDNEIVSEQIDKVLGCLLRMASDQVAPRREQNERHPYLESKPMYRPFKNCIGAIDGTHMTCFPETSEEIKYRGRKGGFTMNVMVVCDFDLCFTFASSGWEGSMHDSSIFKQVLHGKQRDRFPHPEEGKYYLVDSAYPNQKGYMAPYKGCKYHKEGDYRRTNKQPRDDKQWFNRAHSSLRSCAERSIGVLKARWKVLRIEPPFGVRMQKKIIIAAMALHNYIIRNCPNDPELAKAVRADDKYTYEDDNAPDKEGRHQEAENDMEMEELRDFIMNELKKDRKKGLF